MHSRTGRVRASNNGRQETGNLEMRQGKGEWDLNYQYTSKYRGLSPGSSPSLVVITTRKSSAGIFHESHLAQQATAPPPQRHAALFRSLEKSHCHSLFARTQRRGPWNMAWLDRMTPRADDGSHQRLPLNGPNHLTLSSLVSGLVGVTSPTTHRGHHPAGGKPLKHTSAPA